MIALILLAGLASLLLLHDVTVLIFCILLTLALYYGKEELGLNDHKRENRRNRRTE